MMRVMPTPSGLRTYRCTPITSEPSSSTRWKLVKLKGFLCEALAAEIIYRLISDDDVQPCKDLVTALLPFIPPWCGISIVPDNLVKILIIVR